MISFVKGKLVILGINDVVIENNGLGYKIKISEKTKSALPKIEEEVKIFTHMQVREDDISLYGFMTLEEISMFNLLISVSGVGAKASLSILSVLTPIELMLAIISDDITSIIKAKGIGKKIASRLILELKDKINSKTEYMEQLKLTNNKSNNSISIEKEDAINALIALGYEKNEAFKCVLEVALIEMTVETIIKESLKKLSSR